MSNSFPPSFRLPGQSGKSCRSRCRGYFEDGPAAVDPSTATIQYLRVDNRGLDVLVIILGQFARMRAVVKQVKAAKPVEVGLFATEAVMLGARDFYQAIVEPRSRLAREQPQR
jgi:hypothetical protein